MKLRTHLLPAAAGFLLASSLSYAGTTWDGGGADTNINTAANWNDNFNPTLTGGTSTLTFGTGGSTATINAGVNVAGLVLNRDADFLIAAGAGTLTIGSGGITMSLPNATSRTHTISEPVILGANQTWQITNNGAGNAQLTVSGAISGTNMSITKTGSGTLRLSNTGNTFSGGLNIEEGRVELYHTSSGNNNIAGTGNVTLGKVGGVGNVVIDYAATNATTLLNLTGWTLAGSGTVTRSNSSGTGVGWGTAKITGSSGGLIYTASASGAVIQVAAVTSDYTGGTTLTSGTIVLNGTGNADTETAGSFGNASVASNIVTFNGASIRGGQTTPTRTIHNNVSFAVDTTLSPTSTGTVGKLTWAGNVTLNGSGSGRKLTQASSTQDWEFSNKIQDGLVKDLNIDFATGGSRSVILSGANTFTGTLLATGTGGGSLALGNVNAVQHATLDTGSSTTSRAVTFTVAGTNTYNIGGLQGSDDLAIGENRLSVGAKNQATEFFGIISGTGGLTKVGSSSLTLRGANGYTGTTEITEGTLILGTGGGIANSSTINIASGARLQTLGMTIEPGQTLSGFGTVAGDLNVTGTLSIGASPGTMTYEDDLTFNTGSIANFEINSFTSGNFDLALAALSGTQVVTFNGGTLNLIFASGFNTNGSVKIFDFDQYAGTGFDSVVSTGLAAGHTASFDKFTGVVTVVPEPGAALLGGLGALALLRRRR